MKKVRISTLRKMKEDGNRFAMVTAHDALSARLVEKAGIEVILVGDSLGMTALGFTTTLSVTLDMMLHHAAAVARCAQVPLLVGDLPFMTYKISHEEALRNAGRMLSEGGMEAVKVEGGREIAPVIERLVGAGIPVMGHVGLMPQSMHAQGGYRVQGRTEEDAERILVDARAVADAGAFSIVLEAMPISIGRKITEALTIPTIGIGAGPDCDAQVLVFYDLLGLTDRKLPKFVKRYADLFEPAAEGLRTYAEEVRSGQFPGEEHTYGE